MKTGKLGKAIGNFPCHAFGRCTVCGRTTLFVCLDRNSFRNSMICLFCRSASRNRHVAKVIAEIVSKGDASLADLSARGGISVYNTATDDCFSRVFLGSEGYFNSCYRDDMPPGAEIAPRSSCQNIEALTYADSSFDIVITEDVLEHARRPDRGFREIYRVLRPGGHHVFTVPFLFDRPTLVRVETSGPEDVHLLPPEYHGDPLRGKILAYRTFGIDMFAQLDEIGFETRVDFSTYGDRRYGIFDSSVFISRRNG